jgi:two-component system chemotaxis sensor kinase CheA
MSLQAVPEICSRLSAEILLAEPDSSEWVAGFGRLCAELAAVAQEGTPAALLAREAQESLAAAGGSAEELGEVLSEVARRLEELQLGLFTQPSVAGSSPVDPEVGRAGAAAVVGSGSSASPPPDNDILAYFFTHHLEELDRMEELVVASEQSDDPQRTRELRGMMHTLKGDASLVGQEDIAHRCHELEDLLAAQSPRELADTLLGAIDDFRKRIRARKGGTDPATSDPVAQAAAIARAQEDGSQELATPSTAQTSGTIRVDSSRLDLLVDRIGELVIAESMVSQSPELREQASAGLVARLTQLDKITRELQGMAMSLRMMPVRGTFQRMTRLARDTAKKLGKELEFVTTGADTEIDKTLVDALADPLVHLVRNAVDHGLESDAESRERAGKQRAGRIELRAFHRGGSLWIEIEDDGPGLDEDAILAKAVERGLVEKGARLSRQEVQALIFHPGFSTAKAVTDVSGRGIGLDVAERTLRSLRGRIEVRSARGLGTTFTLCLPLTLAIIDGMLVRVGGQRFVVPTLSILRMQPEDSAEQTSVLGRGRLLRCGDELVPIHDLRPRLGKPTSGTETGQILVVECDGQRAALRVDAILGQQQIVVKPLSRLMSTRPGYAGGAILPDGAVGLILDVAALLAEPPVPHPGN